jgi:hypothetical protein
MIITSNYKLNSIEDNVAHFELKQDLTMISEILQYQSFATGKGKGTMLYDVNFKNITDLRSDMEMTLSIDFGGIVMNVNQKNETIRKYDISRKHIE